MHRFLLPLAIIIIASSCQDKAPNYYPPNIDIPEGLYQKYKLRLDTAYLEKNEFEIGLQLSNLKASSENIFPHIQKGIEQDADNCYKIYDWHKLFSEHNFQINLVKSDTLKFIQVYQICETKLGLETLEEYQKEKEDKRDERNRRSKQLDSIGFDLELINQLKDIFQSDQKFRKKLMKKNISEEEKENIWNQINLVDSINLVAVSEILKNGYPQLETVGYDHVSTIWLVLHHQGDYETRIKFRPLLEKAFDNGSLGIGQMNTYDMRTKDIRLANPGN